MRCGPRVRPGMGRAAGVALGVAAVAGAGFAGWTLYRVASAPAPAAPAGPAGPGLAKTETVEAVLATVQRLTADGQPGAAETVLSDAVRQFPVDQDLRLAYADLLMSRQRWGEAYDQYVGAIEIGRVPAPVQFSAGMMASQTDRPELAAAHFDAAMRLDPSEPNYAMYLASAQLKLRRTAEAKASLAIAVRLAPDRAQVWGMLGQIALDENKLGMAAQHLDRARELQPNQPAWVLMRARTHKRAGETEAALELLHTLPDQNLNDPGTLSLLAECYGLLGRPGDAASRYMDAAEQRPDDAGVAFETALWLDRAGERAQAVRWAQRASLLGHPRAGAWLAANVGETGGP